MSEPQCTVQTVRLWLNAFIPLDLEGVEPVPAGLHQGKTMLNTPGPVNAWFLTDGRGFQDTPDAPSRMHSEIELDMVDFRVISEVHRCHPTIQVNPETGEEECCESADTESMAFSEIKMLPEMRTITMRLKGSTKNACLKVGPVKISPNLDYDGIITLRLHQQGHELVAGFEGQVETYPAFEMYVTINGSAATPVFQLGVEPGATPLSLIGPPQRSVRQFITLPCDPAG